MRHARFTAAALLATTVILGGCATNRSELRLAPPTTQAPVASTNAPSIFIRSIKDERIFEQAPSEPSTPSLGFEGAAQATADAKLRAIGRKRNSYGMALGDVFLQDGQTVETVIRENLAAALRDAGFNVRSTASEESSVPVIDVRIKRFWAWMRPGFWAITVNTDIETDVVLSTASNATKVIVHVDDARQFVTDSAWLETIDKALQAYRREAAQQMSRPK